MAVVTVSNDAAKDFMADTYTVTLEGLTDLQLAMVLTVLGVRHRARRVGGIGVSAQGRK